MLYEDAADAVARQREVADSVVSEQGKVCLLSGIGDCQRAACQARRFGERRFLGAIVCEAADVDAVALDEAADVPGEAGKVVQRQIAAGTRERHRLPRCQRPGNDRGAARDRQTARDAGTESDCDVATADDGAAADRPARRNERQSAAADDRVSINATRVNQVLAAGRDHRARGGAAGEYVLDTAAVDCGAADQGTVFDQHNAAVVHRGAVGRAAGEDVFDSTAVDGGADSRAAGFHTLNAAVVQ